MIIIFRKFEIEFYQKIAKAGVVKKYIDNHPISSRNYAIVYRQTLEEVPKNLVPETNNKKFKKIQKIWNCKYF